MLKRTESLIKKHWKSLVGLLGVSGLADLAKEFVRHEAMNWVSEKLGPFGRWLVTDPASVLKE